MPGSAARRDEVVGARIVREQEILNIRPRVAGQSTPFCKRDQNSRLHASLGDDLRTIPLASDQQFAEARFRILHRPSLHATVSLKDEIDD